MTFKSTEKVYFPGLNGIRAIAALLVVFSHISLGISNLGFSGHHGIDMAGYGVTMFFVLSGYLITYLLLLEYQKNRQISYRKFYMRRILRIWPIYYLSIFIALVCMYFLEQKVSGNGLFFYLFLMANVPFVFGGTLNFVSQLWSVGVEEQFYLLWPWLFKQRAQLLKIMLGIILVYMVLRLILRITENGPFYTLLGITRFHCMAIGGIGALMVFEKRSVLKYVYHPVAQVICWSIMIVSLYQPFHTFSIIDGELYALIFLVLIINVSTNPRSIIKLENKLLNWLGKISYGIYVYHMFAIAFVVNVLQGRLHTSYFSVAIIYAGILSCTLLLAHISYNYFEKFFLDRKHKFSIIKSGTPYPEQILT